MAMAARDKLGTKLRRLRREQGMTQAELARRLDISASYLNLIEHNQRALTAPLLLKVGELLGADLDAFTNRADAKLMAEIGELARDPLFDDVSFSDEDMEDLVNLPPALGEVLRRSYRGYLVAQERVRALGDQLSDNPLIEEATHQLRTLLTSIRSLSEIVRDNADLTAKEQRNFLNIVVGESERLSGVVDRLYDFIGQVGGDDGGQGGFTLDDVNAFLETNENHFDALEKLAEADARRLRLDVRNRIGRLTADLGKRHRVEVRFAPPDTMAAGAGVDDLHWDPADRTVILSDLLPAHSAAFQLACLRADLDHGRVLDELIGDSANPMERELCRAALARYYAGALLMPYVAFYEAARELRYDIDRLRHRFDVSFEQACHRLTTLNRAGVRGIRLHFLRVDIAGNVSKVYRGTGLRIPRRGGVCGLWNVHSAFLHGGEIDRQVIELPDGETYFTIARALAKPSAEPAQPPARYAVALGCRLGDATEMAYADGLDLSQRRARVQAGTTCRLCERFECRVRAQPSIMRQPAHRMVVAA
jgi:predicted transcriptional regulator/transcriptional regulator with XRE-family HTH domain